MDVNATGAPGVQATGAAAPGGVKGTAAKDAEAEVDGGGRSRRCTLGMLIEACGAGRGGNCASDVSLELKACCICGATGVKGATVGWVKGTAGCIGGATVCWVKGAGAGAGAKVARDTAAKDVEAEVDGEVRSRRCTLGMLIEACGAGWATNCASDVSVKIID